MKNKLIIICGPTAVGKTSLSIAIARQYDTEIISADSRQIFKELNIGTAKPSARELKQVPHHFINSHSIIEHYSAGEYERDAQLLLEGLFKSTETLVGVGGSGLYLKALAEGLDEMPEVSDEIRTSLNSEWEKHGLEKLLIELESKDPEYYESVDKKNPRRIIRALEVTRSSGKPYSWWRKQGKSAKDRPYETVIIGLQREREDLYDRIEKRMDLMLEEGLIEEVKSLTDYQDKTALQTLGYSEVFGYLNNEYDLEECIRLLKRNSRRFAKRQITWFKQQDNIQWFHADDNESIIGYLDDRISH